LDTDDIVIPSGPSIAKQVGKLRRGHTTTAVLRLVFRILRGVVHTTWTEVLSSTGGDPRSA